MKWARKVGVVRWADCVAWLGRTGRPGERRGGEGVDPGGRSPPRFVAAEPRLLDLDLGAGGLELGLDVLGFVLGHAFLDGLRGAVDQVLGFL